MANYNFLQEAKVYLATNKSVESGLTLSATYARDFEIDGIDTGFRSSSDPAIEERSKQVLMAGEVVLPSTFSETQCLFEHGGSGQGTWIGITIDSGVTNFHFRTGDGQAGAENQVQSNSRIYKKIPISQIPEFDGKMHTVAWELDPPNNIARFWIDNRLVISETISSYSLWSGGDDGAWLKGYDQIAGFGGGSAGNPYRTAWTGTEGSDLRIYSKQALTNTNIPLRLDVTSDISFSQNFTDNTYKQRTLHHLNKLHEASNITMANPASFGFTIPALVENDLQQVVNLLVDYDSSGFNIENYDLYIEFPNETYLLKKCVSTNGTFMIEKLENLKLEIQGEASKLSKAVYRPSVEVSRSATDTYQKVDYLSVQIGDTDPVPQLSNIFNVSVELQNSISWIPNETVHEAMKATNASTSTYPSNYTLDKRTLSGSIGQYITDENDSNVQDWKTNAKVIIKAGVDANTGFQFDLSNCTFTNRADVSAIMVQSYDWRMNDNPTDLGTKITFNTNN